MKQIRNYFTALLTVGLISLHVTNLQAGFTLIDWRTIGRCYENIKNEAKKIKNHVTKFYSYLFSKRPGLNNTLPQNGGRISEFGAFMRRLDTLKQRSSLQLMQECKSLPATMAFTIAFSTNKHSIS